MMKKASPLELNKSLEAAKQLVTSGVNFVPIPITHDEDGKRLKELAINRTELIIAAIEKQQDGLSDYKHRKLDQIIINVAERCQFFLKDELPALINGPCRKKPTRYNIDDVVRYGVGKTALFQITEISHNHGGEGKDRYYGKHFYGDSVGAYIDQLEDPSDEDLALWIKEHPQTEEATC